MNPPNNNDNNNSSVKPAGVPFPSSQGTDVPPPPQSNPMQTGEVGFSAQAPSPLPSTPTGGSESPTFGSASTQVPPAEGSAIPSGAGSSNVVSSGGRGFPKKLVFLILGLVALAAIAFFAIQILLPRLSGVGGEVSITWWGLWEEESVMAPVIASYEASHPGVKVTYIKQAKEDYRERLTSALAQGTGPDIFHFHATWVPMFMDSITPVQSDVISASDFSTNYYTVMANDLALGGGFAGIPLSYDGLGLFINEEIFATYGKEPPTTWNELRDMAIDLTIKNESGVIQQAGVALGRTENVDHWPEVLSLMMIQNGVDMVSPKGELAEQALLFFTAFSTSYGVWDETLPSSTAAFANGQAAMILAPSWRVHEIKQSNPNLSFRVVPVPQLPKTDPSEPDITLSSYWVEGVSNKSANQQAAFEFLKFMSEKENLEAVYSGASNIRAFGGLYPRVDMRELLSADPLTGGFIAYAQNAKSTFLSSRTFDGATGINSQIIKYMEDAVNSLTRETSGNAKAALETATAGIQSVLVSFGLLSPTTTTGAPGVAE